MSADAKITAAAGKPPLWLIAWQCLLGVARVFQYGAKKYAPGNWHNATLDDGAAERYMSAVSRHCTEMQEPNGLFTRTSLAARDESGAPHIDHAICSLIMLRGILIKEGVLPADPGECKPPATKVVDDPFPPPITKVVDYPFYKPFPPPPKPRRQDFVRQIGQMAYEIALREWNAKYASGHGRVCEHDRPCGCGTGGDS